LENGVVSALDPKLIAVLNTLDEYEDLRYPNRNSPTEVGEDDWVGIAELVGTFCNAMPEEIERALDEINSGGYDGRIRKAGRVLMRKKIDNDV